jgi:ElaB/YqjD/DUF883 family membrane-anchored ribosome-binding protein
MPGDTALEAYVKRRGLRLEVEEPTEWQKQNKRWLANHPWVTATVAALIFALVGLLLAAKSDIPWLSLPVGGIVGLAVGGLLGWAFSVEHREGTPRGVTLALYVVAGVSALAMLFALKVT